jgi:DNA repair exonuclease SbcCD nuclease subunit
MKKIVIDINDDKLVFEAYLHRYPMPEQFKNETDWIKEKIKRDLIMIVQEYIEEKAVEETEKEVADIRKAAKDKAKLPDNIIE